MNNKENSAGIFSQMVEYALLISLQPPGMDEAEARSHLMELEGLVVTMGLTVAESQVVKVRGQQPRYLIGSGKADEICRLAEEIDADCIIFDDDLSPSQQRNWEQLSNLCVIDRREVILDIFAGRASTREAVLQVGLARMEYSLPRLTRAWTHLSRQRGGTRGTRGEGETQLEADRRIVLRKITRMKKELEKVRRQRATLRKQRQAVPIPTAALVGYTNAGKSTLLNLLTEAHVLTEDKLFATLDPTTRRIRLATDTDLLLTDTVGFIRKLPHSLVDAFKATLEETVQADFLIHVLDASNPEIEAQYRTTMEVLEELGAADKPVVTVFNKIDLCPDPDAFLAGFPFEGDAVYLSASTGRNADTLIKILEKLVLKNYYTGEFRIPADRYDLAAAIHRSGKVLNETYDEEGLLIRAQVPHKIEQQLTAFKS